jgi:protein-S-isoprenylcysteine O-methyltransferase Ste14
MPLIIILPGVVSLVAGLNHRFGWPPVVSAAWQVAGIMVYILVETFATWAMAVNAFFSSQVRIQTDRGHSVITGGPYRFVRHPAYAAGILAALASAPFLESWWALIPAVASIPFFILRTSLEDQTLQDELPGYREYAQKVRYRLLPGIW